MPSDAERSQHWGGRRGAAPTARAGDAAGNLVEASAADSPPLLLGVSKQKDIYCLSMYSFR